MLNINTRYIRTAPDKTETLSIARNETELNYHISLIGEGYTYKEVEEARMPKNVCTFACEG